MHDMSIHNRIIYLPSNLTHSLTEPGSGVEFRSGGQIQQESTVGLGQSYIHEVTD